MLKLFKKMPERLRALINAAGFGLFVLTLLKGKGELSVLVALAERWQDTNFSFHFPPREMTMTPADFSVITSLRVGDKPITFYPMIHLDDDALKWFLGMKPTRQ